MDSTTTGRPAGDEHRRPPAQYDQHGQEPAAQAHHHRGETTQADACLGAEAAPAAYPKGHPAEQGAGEQRDAGQRADQDLGDGRQRGGPGVDAALTTSADVRSAEVTSAQSRTDDPSRPR